MPSRQENNRSQDPKVYSWFLGSQSAQQVPPSVALADFVQSLLAVAPIPEVTRHDFAMQLQPERLSAYFATPRRTHENGPEKAGAKPIRQPIVIRLRRGMPRILLRGQIESTRSLR